VNFQSIDACRSCGGTNLLPVLDLGEQPLANSYRRPDDESPQQRFPLALVCCAGCSLVQLTGTVPPMTMFDDYAYFSSYSSTMVEAMGVLASRLTTTLGLGSDDLVVEVASNDGYLLKHYIDLGVPVLGIEPARNIAEVAMAAGVPTIAEYFGRQTAQRVRASHGAATVMHANNVMAHVPDINDFVAGFAALLDDTGVAVVESPYLGRFISDTEFDTTYHEHVFYYSLTAVNALVSRHGLVVSDIEHLDIHGGTLRCFLRHAGGPVTQAVHDLLAEESREGVATEAYYRDFATRVGHLTEETNALLRDLKDRGASIGAYGAAAKGTVLLNHLGAGPDLIDFVADRSPHKQGLVMPGVAIPIVAAEELAKRRPDYTLLLAWNFADEILAQQADYRAAGGKFIIPVPHPRVV
jgi:C-methyltransferase C-terminal domain/Putative zinc binding domain/Methyltransferase domain